MPLSRAQMPQISILASEDTQLYPSTQKSQKSPFKRVTRHAPISSGGLYAYTRLHAHVYIIISPYISLYPYTHAAISMCTYTHTQTHAYLEAGICRGMSICVCMHSYVYSYVYSYVQIYTATSMCRYTGTDTQPSMCMHQEPP